MKSTITIAASILILNACGGDNDEEDTVAPVQVATIDTSNEQEIEEINTTVISELNITTTATCRLGEELVKGGEKDLLDPSKWTMTLNSIVPEDLRVNDCLVNGEEESRSCIQVNPEAAGTGMYQSIVTTVGTRYRVSAELVGADNYQDKNNFTLGSSYVSVEDDKPVEKSIPIAYSEKVKGDVPKVVTFDFDATKAESYVQLRGDTAFAYPSAFYISVKELIVDKNGTDSNDTVPCNL